jgi:glycosyltransferase involved in cell wall biosynthesis
MRNDSDAMHLTIVSYHEVQSGHSQDIFSLRDMLVRLGIKAERFVISANLQNLQLLPLRPAILVMNAANAVAVSHAIKAWCESITVVSYCAWELPKPPKGFSTAPIDVVLAGSMFSYESFKLARSDVQYLPMLVQPLVSNSMLRASVGGPFTFLTVLNLCSSASRKNALGAINAFSKAFAVADFGVKLVLKVSGRHCDPNEFERIRSASEHDRRIVLLHQSLTYSATQQLFNRCDAYVSLHRSEGFGRTIAEAMLHEKPVIATGWSGSMDLTTPETSFLCDFMLRPLSESEYLEIEGQSWAEPDVHHAASLMAELAMLPLESRKEVGRLAMERVQRKFTIPPNIDAYREIFSEVIV